MGFIESRTEDLTGKKYGRLTVVSFEGYKLEKNGKHRANWLCVCECGEKTIVEAHSLKSGNTKSCGCLKSDLSREQGHKNKTHGLCIEHKRLRRNILHHWEIITNPENPQYRNYGDMEIPQEYIKADGSFDFVKFSNRVVELNPVESELYEKDRSITIDKDILNSGKCVREFKPEVIKFVSAMENNHNRRNTLKTETGESVAELCKSIGMIVCVNGHCTKEYKRVDHYFRKYKKLPQDIVSKLVEAGVGND